MTAKRLSHRDFDALQRTILELYAYRDTDSFKAAAPEIFLKIIPGDYFGVVDSNIDSEATAAVPRITGFFESHQIIPNVAERLLTYIGSHPFTTYSLKCGGDPGALKMSDFFTLAQFRDSELYQEFYRYADVERLLAFASMRGSGMATVNVVRDRHSRDFTERDRLILNLLRPHFNQARQNAELASAKSANDARPLTAYGLSAREMDICQWLGGGKTNPEIAIILGISARTVEKHMEKILEKLGVENRTAAAVMIAAVK